MMSRHASAFDAEHSTDVLSIDQNSIHFVPTSQEPSFIKHSSLSVSDQGTRECLDRAAYELRESDTPVAFPTETVYGLGADATRSEAVKNIFAAKGRPADNPLIVHVHSTEQLGSLLRPSELKPKALNSLVASGADDAIPQIYRPLIRRFWPGPLTIILRNPVQSSLAKEVTAGLSTFGARMPSHPVALALLKASDRPLAAPSANASTKPSPTTAAHVLHDLKGKIRTIIDGGSCGVGVESTVVDGLSDPPTILRPGGVSIDMLRNVERWENVRVGYQDKAGGAGSKPKAPGMKYKHYSPEARVVLFEAGLEPPSLVEAVSLMNCMGKFGVIRTAKWPRLFNQMGCSTRENTTVAESSSSSNGGAGLSAEPRDIHLRHYECATPNGISMSVCDVYLGDNCEMVARNIFAALRLLDLNDVNVILVEGIEDSAGDTAAAVMNRLRKAAEVKR